MMMLDLHIVTVTPFAQNCHILHCKTSNKAAVVDPGGDIDLIVAALEKQDCELESILITHGHADHAGAAQGLKDKFSVPIIGPHIDDKFWIDAIPQQAAMFGLSGAESFSSDQWLQGGEKVKVGVQELEVLHCPGHTPGHVVFFAKAAGIASVGDVLFAGSIGRTDFPKGNHDQLIHSIRKKLFKLPDNTEFIPGHGPTSTFGAEKKSNPFVADIRFG